MTLFQINFASKGAVTGCNVRAVHPFFWVLAAMASMMAYATLLECRSLTIAQTSKAAGSHLEIKRNIQRPKTNKEMLDATFKVRRQLAGLGEAMEKNSELLMAPPSTDFIYSNMTLDISPVYDVVDVAIDTLGVKGLYFWVFFDSELDWWFENRPETEERWDCWETHGTHLCDAYEPWWFFHFIGAITAEKLFLEGSVLWDPITGEYANDMSDLLHKIHDKMAATKDWVGDMSFHAQHALLWHYAEVKLLDMDSYPTEMAKAMCGDEYAYRKVSQGDGKSIGRECFHGMGHAIFYVIARQQMRTEQQKRKKFGLSSLWAPKEMPWTARTQFRPSAGLELTQESWCKIYKYCQTDLDIVEGYNVDVSELCIGGARHSVRIFSRDDDMRWHYQTKMSVRNQFFDDEMNKCRELERQSAKV